MLVGLRNQYLITLKLEPDILYTQQCRFLVAGYIKVNMRSRTFVGMSCIKNITTLVQITVNDIIECAFCKSPTLPRAIRWYKGNRRHFFFFKPQKLMLPFSFLSPSLGT